MIKTRIATAATIFTFGFAGLAGAVVAVAAPAHADTTQVTVQVEGTSMTGTAGDAVEDARATTEQLNEATRGPDVAPVPSPGNAAGQDHVPFPNTPAPHSEHNGQGHKGLNEQQAHAPGSR
ncbi:hypothetical protein ACTXG7_14165 [Mycolicibacterium sp. Dal123E01]|uniref:hypothetical protein n=1 Tax=Mycolicibacterium sp. Dal123E01 TaxID=3457578 RepID=UPI00403ECD9F